MRPFNSQLIHYNIIKANKTMLLRHLYEQEISSIPFIKDQLAFQKNIYARIVKQCGKDDTIQSNQFDTCVSKWQERINKYGLLVQYLINDREKNLEKQLRECRQTNILKCVNQKTLTFIQHHFQRDLNFFKKIREDLLI